MNAAITALLAGLRARTWHGGATLRLHNESCEAILALLRRDWAVRVLDAWAAFSVRHDGRSWRSSDWGGNVDRYYVVLAQRGAEDRVLEFCNSSPDAARLAAAEAVWPELPESVRAELGERP